jgi:hypothetical protein
LFHIKAGRRSTGIHIAHIIGCTGHKMQPVYHLHHHPDGHGWKQETDILSRQKKHKALLFYHMKQGVKMEPEKFKQLEAKLKSLFEEAEKEDETPKVSGPVLTGRKVVIRRRNGVSMKLVS